MVSSAKRVSNHEATDYRANAGSPPEHERPTARRGERVKRRI